MRHVVMFSGGAGSYCAARRVIGRFGPENTTLLFADTRMEDEDLYRFLKDAQSFLKAELVTISDGRTPWELFFDQRFMGNSRVDLCSRVLKRELMDKWVKAHYKPNEVRCYVGIDWMEHHRFERMAPRKLPYIYEAPMLESPLYNKSQMMKVIQRDGIELPRLYLLGFAHNNCGGFCVKAGVGHFKTLLEKMPSRYAEHEAREQEFQQLVGKPVTILRRQKNGVRIQISLKALREEIQGGQAEVDEYEIGGCGCAIDTE